MIYGKARMFHGDFAGVGAEAEVVAAEFGIEFCFAEGGFEERAEEEFFFRESVGVGVIRIFPVGEQALACDGIFPEQSPVFKPRDVAEVRIFSPGSHGS
jgi:hypothetical protein